MSSHLEINKHHLESFFNHLTTRDFFDLKIFELLCESLVISILLNIYLILEGRDAFMGLFSRSAESTRKFLGTDVNKAYRVVVIPLFLSRKSNRTLSKLGR